MTTLILILIVPLAWPIAAKVIFGKSLDWGELAINLAVGCAIAGLTYWAGLTYMTLDYEVWNGEVLAKQREEVSCSHSYSCNCRQTCSGSGKDRSCSTTCDTCYEHSHDYDWVLKTNVERITIDRVDRQGVHMPRRFEIAKVGDPVAVPKSYTNYVKAVPETLFNAEKGIDIGKFQGKIRGYPIDVRDYHYVDRAISIGVPIPMSELHLWSDGIANLLKELGPKKQANVVVLFVNDPDPNYYYALRRSWLGGKKNDIVVIIGSTEYPKIEWVRVMSWTDKEIFRVTLRDDIEEIGTIDRERILTAVREDTLKLYERKRMRDFEYLKREIEPPTWVIALAVFLGAGSSVGLSLFFTGRLRNPFRRRYRYR